jgi:hypothetical protein
MPGLSVCMVSAEGITPLPGSFNQPARSRAFGQTERLHLFRGDEPLVVVLTTAAFAAGFPPGYPTREVLRRFLPNRAGRPMLRVMRVPCSGMPVGNAATRLPPSCAYWSLQNVLPPNPIIWLVREHSLSRLSRIDQWKHVLQVFRTMLSFRHRENVIHFVSLRTRPINTKHQLAIDIGRKFDLHPSIFLPSSKMSQCPPAKIPANGATVGFHYVHASF